MTRRIDGVLHIPVTIVLDDDEVGLFDAWKEFTDSVKDSNAPSMLSTRTITINGYEMSIEPRRGMDAGDYSIWLDEWNGK